MAIAQTDANIIQRGNWLTMLDWHVIYTKPHQEFVVSNQLEARDLEVYLPVLHFDRGYRRGIALEPFFPTYVFVKVDLTSSQATGLGWMVGVRALVEIDHQPVSVPEAVIESLHQRLDPVCKRVLRKSEWLFQPGQRVLITEGPFKNFSAVFQHGLSGEQRAQVLIDFLGSTIRANVQLHQLALAS